ncbi:MAG: M48 family metallopeptidase [Gammaproteobacteria bacterium]|nr:M48 family metallopeptidase [Gammaproteobacteria bacterium]
MLSFKKTIIGSFLSLCLINQTLAQNNLKLPDLGSAAASTLSIEKELRIGEAYMMMLRSQLPIVGDPVLEEYIQDIGHQLVANANDVKTPFSFFLVNNKAINAFAFFGGHIGVHTSLLQLADTESELASVLSHEITHVTQRHIARSMEARAQSAPTTTALLLASIALAVAGAPQVGMAGIQTSVALSRQFAINYTRYHEREADRIGIEVLAKSHFNPQGAPLFFEKLATKYRFAKKQPPMLRTHPVSEQRIADTRMRAAIYPVINLPFKLNFQLAKARVIVRYTQQQSSEITAILNRKFSSNDSIIQTAKNYGQALLLLADKKPDQALSIINQLRLNDPNNLFYIDTLTDIYLEKNQGAKAVAMLEKFFEIMPNNAIVTLNLSNALLAIDKPKRAVYLLEQFLVKQSNNMTAWQMLKEAHNQAKNNVGRYIAMAEIAALYGNHKQGLKHLYSAHNLIKSDDNITKSKVEARVRQFRLLRDDLKNLKI